MTKTQIRCPKLFCVLSKDSPMLILPAVNLCSNKARAWRLIKGDKALYSSGLLNVNILLSVVLFSGMGFYSKRVAKKSPGNWLLFYINRLQYTAAISLETFPLHDAPGHWHSSLLKR